MKKIHAVGIVFENEASEILALKRHAKSLEGNSWGLVGGNIDDGEDKLQAALREAKEEVGHSIPADSLEFIKTYFWEFDYAQVIFEVFRYKIARHEVDIELDKAENTEFMWEKPDVLRARNDMMHGLYPILEDLYGK